MSELTFHFIQFAVGTLVMGASLLLWRRDKHSGHPVRGRTHGLLTTIALFLMYPAGGYLFYSLMEPLLPLDDHLWFFLGFMPLCGRVTLVCSVWLYVRRKNRGIPVKQRGYAVAIVTGLLLTWFLDITILSTYLYQPLLKLFR